MRPPQRVRTEWRLNVRLKDKELLARYIGKQGLDISGSELARRAGVGPGIVNHLVAGRRSTCNLKTARGIEEALGCPRGLLFVESVSAVRADGKQPVEVAA